MNSINILENFPSWASPLVDFIGGSSHLSMALKFFVLDSIEIAFLLFTIVFFVSFVKSYFPAYKIKQLLSSRFSFGGNIIASFLGVITPFCSCSAVPLFIGLVESGVPLGVTFSYLVAAPMINEVALVLLFALFGWKVSLLYLIAGVSIAVLTGVILGKMNLEHLVEGFVRDKKVDPKSFVETEKTMAGRIRESKRATVSLFKKVFPYVLLGVGVGALIHGYAPEDLLSRVAGRDNPLAVLIAVVLGVPLYSNAAGTIPIVESLIAKGLPLGTALAFMMSVTALSFPEMVILRKILKPKLLLIYVAIIATGIVIVGYLFNLILQGV